MQRCLFHSDSPQHRNPNSHPRLCPGYDPDSCFGGASSAAEKRKQLATIDETCPNCGFEEMTFYTMQLRSVDEGQTVFYSCVPCGHTFSVNN